MSASKIYASPDTVRAPALPKKRSKGLKVYIANINAIPGLVGPLIHYMLPTDYIAKSGDFLARKSGAKVSKFVNYFLTVLLVVCVRESFISLRGRVTIQQDMDKEKFDNKPKTIKALQSKINEELGDVETLKEELKGLENGNTIKDLKSKIEQGLDYVETLKKELADLEKHTTRSITTLYINGLSEVISNGLIVFPALSMVDSLLFKGKHKIPTYSNYIANPKYYATLASLSLLQNPFDTTVIDEDSDNTTIVDEISDVKSLIPKIVLAVAAVFVWQVSMNVLGFHARKLLKNV
ncbi:MAG: hypothetical protein SP4CHLAM5_09860 [Chlamydiia bacterium]|nr:hypothetical protein [Chlamydiia bacterium]MCH9618844.1 hypothetical protein [Chlamydiia bacterium]MCH9624354.1 hypothetical protein [Chlamydiia bacterium]